MAEQPIYVPSHYWFGVSQRALTAAMALHLVSMEMAEQTDTRPGDWVLTECIEGFDSGTIWLVEYQGQEDGVVPRIQVCLGFDDDEAEPWEAILGTIVYAPHLSR